MNADIIYQISENEMKEYKAAIKLAMHMATDQADKTNYFRLLTSRHKRTIKFK